MKNPNKYIRKAAVSLLAGVGYPVFDTQYPNAATIPNLYCLMTATSKSEINRTKCDKLWNCSLSFDIQSRSQRGYADTSVLDDAEEALTNVIAPDTNTDIDLSAYGLKVYNTFLDQPSDMVQTTPNETLLRRVVRIRMIVGTA